MIPFILLLGLGVILLAGSSSASTPSDQANPNATTPGYESGGGSLSGAVNIDSLTSISPAMQGRPAIGQYIEIMFGGQLGDSPHTLVTIPPFPIQVVTIATYAPTQTYPNAVIAAKITPSTIQYMIGVNPYFAKWFPAPLQHDGMFVQFNANRVWALGAVV